MGFIVNTSNQDTIYNSLEELLKVKKELIQYYILRNGNLLRRMNRPFKDMKISHFFDFLSEKARRKITFQDFDFVTLFHLTTRTSRKNAEKEPLYNLFDVLTEDTELKRRLEYIGLSFYKENNKLKTVYKGTPVDWRTFRSGIETPTVQMIINRLEGNSLSPPDKCVNGFLFNGAIYENGNVQHIRYLPEIVENMLRVLGEYKAIKDMCAEVSPFIITFKANVREIIFDGSRKLNVKQTQFRILKHCLHYLSNQLYGTWDEEDNPIIRLIDDRSIPADQILEVREIKKI